MATEKSELPMFLQIIDAFFVNKEFIDTITYETAKQNIFMVLRRLAAKYPDQANVFNDAKVNPLDVIKFWRDYLNSGKIPYWTKVSGQKKAKEAKEKEKLIKVKPKYTFTKQELKMYKDKFWLSDKDFDDLMRFFPDDTIEKVNDYIKMFKDK